MNGQVASTRVGSRAAWDWLVVSWRWPGASLMAAGFLIAQLPIVYASQGLAVTLIFAQLPAYLIHQWEEHADDRFRTYFNKTFGGGRELLTPAATFWINSLCVWGVDSAAFYAAVYLSPAVGLTAAYLSVVNALSHLGQAARLRGYNPGLTTAATLLLPLGAWAIAETGDQATKSHHASGIVIAIGAHLAIIVHCRRRMGQILGSEASSSVRESRE